jgi:hypothetical protein
VLGGDFQLGHSSIQFRGERIILVGLKTPDHTLTGVTHGAVLQSDQERIKVTRSIHTGVVPHAKRSKFVTPTCDIHSVHSSERCRCYIME